MKNNKEMSMWDAGEYLDNIGCKLDSFYGLLSCECPPNKTLKKEDVIVVLDMVSESIKADVEAIRQRLNS